MGRKGGRELFDHLHCVYQYKEHYHCIDEGCNFAVSLFILMGRRRVDRGRGRWIRLGEGGKGIRGWSSTLCLSIQRTLLCIDEGCNKLLYTERRREGVGSVIGGGMEARGSGHLHCVYAVQRTLPLH